MRLEHKERSSSFGPFGLVSLFLYREWAGSMNKKQAFRFHESPMSARELQERSPLKDETLERVITVKIGGVDIYEMVESPKNALVQNLHDLVRDVEAATPQEVEKLVFDAADFIHEDIYEQDS